MMSMLATSTKKEKWNTRNSTKRKPGEGKRGPLWLCTWIALRRWIAIRRGHDCGWEGDVTRPRDMTGRKGGVLSSEYLRAVIKETGFTLFAWGVGRCRSHMWEFFLGMLLKHLVLCRHRRGGVGSVTHARAFPGRLRRILFCAACVEGGWSHIRGFCRGMCLKCCFVQTPECMCRGVYGGHTGDVFVVLFFSVVLLSSWGGF